MMLATAAGRTTDSHNRFCSLLRALQNHVQATALGRDNISSLLDYTPQLLSDNNFKVCCACAWCGC